MEAASWSPIPVAANPARRQGTCDYGWIVNTHVQCVEYGVPFHFHQTGAKLTKIIPDGQGGHFRKTFEIPREYQHEQARKAGLDYGGGIEIPMCLVPEWEVSGKW